MNNKSTAPFPCLLFVVFYDAKNQLVRHDSVTQNASFTWEYDPAGNITARKRYAYTTGTLGTPTETRSYVYGNSSWGDLLTSYNGLPITYDGMGNMTSYNGRTYSWNGRELSGISGGGNTYSYKYNAAGFRTSKTVNGTTTEYFLNGSQLLAQKTGDTHLWFFYDSEGNRVGLISGGLIFYYLYNVQGDVVAIVRASTGQIVARYSYDAWGNCTVTNAEGYITGTKNPFRYRGYYFDAETGMYYLGSRYYNPELGRFISPDVFISTGQGLLGCNMFAYCNNNPVNMADYAGGEPISIGVATAVGIVAILLATAAAYISTPIGQRSFRGFISSLVDSYNILKVTAINVFSSSEAFTSSIETDQIKTYSVYFLEDDSGIIQYVGRVSDTGYEKRMSYHKQTKGYLPAYRIQGLSYAEARGLEELGMIKYHTLNPGKYGSNQIHGISNKNPKGPLYLTKALSCLTGYLENKREQFILNLFD
ncbi:MAG: RHS repeat-associated core domain-containing protein [Oscillospiraceae bacterium]|nr:RHS repeat-associated core domain-containing protein [Oscillospiraceae bacterium]